MAVRIIPYSVYDVPAIEFWLEEMSRKGKHFKKFTAEPWGYFRELDPQEYRYRLEPCRRKESAPDSETIAAYYQAGWDYVTTRKDKTFHVWRSRKNVEPQEIHTDAVVQSYSYEWLERRVKRDTVIVLLTVVAAVLFILWFITGTSVGAIVHPSSILVPQLMFVASMYSFFVYQVISDLTAMRRLLRSLRAGLPVARGHRFFPVRKLAWYGYFAAFLLYLLLIWLEPVNQGMNWDGDPAEYPVPIPFVSVEKLGREKQTEGAIYWGTSYLAERIRIIEGDGTVYSPKEGWSSIYYPLHAEVFRLRLKFLADDLLADMVEYQKENRPMVEQLQDDRFEEAWYAADE